MKVALLDDFDPFIQQSFSDWNWEVINAKKWSIDDLKKNAPHLNGLVIRSKFPLNQNNFYRKFFKILVCRRLRTTPSRQPLLYA